MITKRRLALLSTLSAAPAFAAPFLAIGDNAELFVTAHTEVRYEDNVTFSSSDELEDEAFEVTPGVEITFGKNSLTKGSFAAFEKITSYSDNNDLNSNLTNLIFTSKYDGARLQLGADASFRELNQNSRDIRSAATLVRRDVYAASVDGEYAVTEKSKVGAAGRYDWTQYQVAGYTDQKSYTVPVNYYFAITEKVDLSAGVQYRNTDVIDEVAGVNSDSEDYYFNVGARGEFTAKLSGKFSVGYLTREPDDAARKDESSIGLKAGLAYAFSPKTTFTLDLSNDFQTGADASGSENSSVTFGASTSLTAALGFNASIGYSKIDYITTDREDDYIFGGIGFTYVINEHVNLEAGYSYYDNDTDAAGAAFTANIVRIGANFRY